MNFCEITLSSGKKLLLDVNELKTFFDSCEGKIPEHVSQAALDGLANVLKLIRTENKLLAHHFKEVAEAILANASVLA